MDLYLAGVSPNQHHKRADKVGHMIQQELATLLLNGVKDPRVGFVTITEVRLTDDLRTARVYVSVYGTDAERAASLAGLRGATPYLRRELVHRVRMQYAPELIFCADESLDRASRLEQVFSAITKGDEGIAEQGPAEIVPVATTRSDLAKSAEIFEHEAHAAATLAEAGRGARKSSSKSKSKSSFKSKSRISRR